MKHILPAMNILCAATVFSVLSLFGQDAKRPAPTQLQANPQNRPFIADEKIIYRSPEPEKVRDYTPALLEGFNGRFIAAIDLGGPGTNILDGPRTGNPSSPGGNQVRVFLSDDRGETWRDTPTRLPMKHEILFKAGDFLYMIGHANKLLITRSDDNGETWSEPALLDDKAVWHQSCGAVDHFEGKIFLAYEQRHPKGHVWPGTKPVLLAAKETDDLTKRESWRFSQPFDPDYLMTLGNPVGINVRPPRFYHSPVSAGGILETNVVRPKTGPFADKDGHTVALLMRANTGHPDIGAVLKGTENPDGTLSIGRFEAAGGMEWFFIHIPGANMKFHLAFDSVTNLFWLVHSQMDGIHHDRSRLALSYSPDLLNWTFAGLVAAAPSYNSARHYATMIISGDDIFILSRSGDEHAHSPHDGNITTFHRVLNFRKLIY